MAGLEEYRSWEPEAAWKAVLRGALAPVARGFGVVGAIFGLSVVAAVSGLIAESFEVAAIVFFVLSTAAFFVRALILQRRLNALEFVAFEARHDQTPSHDLQVGANERYSRNVTLWVIVKNHGPTADFAARVHNVVTTEGTPTWGDSYSVRDVAWEMTADRFDRISRGGEAALRLATYSHDPATLWFWIPQSPTYSPGQHGVGIRWQRPSGTTTFDLELVNVTSGLRIVYRGEIRFDDGTVVFQIANPEPTPNTMVS